MTGELAQVGTGIRRLAAANPWIPSEAACDLSLSTCELTAGLVQLNQQWSSLFLRKTPAQTRREQRQAGKLVSHRLFWGSKGALMKVRRTVTAGPPKVVRLICMHVDGWIHAFLLTRPSAGSGRTLSQRG